MDKNVKATNCIHREGSGAEPKKVLLISDLAGYSTVAMSAMLSVLSHFGFRMSNIPTALVSNNFAYGRFAMLDTTDYMRDTMQVWDGLGFYFDAIATGIVISEEQVKLVLDYCSRAKNKGTLIFTDPVMGDDGTLYNGVSQKTIGYMRKLIGTADYIVPNYTEACYLTGYPYRKESISADESRKLVDGLRSYCRGSIVITSCCVDGQKSVVGYDAAKEQYISLPYDEVPVAFPGTGDIFASVFLGRLLNGTDFQSAVASAMKVVSALIMENQSQKDKLSGISLETGLSIIDRL